MFYKGFRFPKKIIFLTTIEMFLLFSYLGCKNIIEKENEQKEPILISICISKKPSKLKYEYNDFFDITGLEIKAKYSDMSEKVVANWTSSIEHGTRLTKEGTFTVTISYEDKTASFNISVIKDKKLLSIYISQEPLKQQFDYDDFFDISGLVVKAKYSDDSENVIPYGFSSEEEGYSIMPKPNTRLSTSGNISVTITFKDKNLSFVINVKEDESITSIGKFVFVEVNNSQIKPETNDLENQSIINLPQKSFYISDHEVTQGEYEFVMGYNPSHFNLEPLDNEIQSNRPVEMVSWYDAIYFCNKKSIKEGINPCYFVDGDSNPSNWNYIPHERKLINGTITCDFNLKGYRLPTVEEWTYAAKGGKLSNNFSYSGSNILDEVAWYNGNSCEKSHEVMKKSANELELFDMNGNVTEWCWGWSDFIIGGSHVSLCIDCGGSYLNANTSYSIPFKGYNYFHCGFEDGGFRLVQSL